MFALATASRLRCEPHDTGADSVGWQRCRRQLLQQNRDKVIVCAQGFYGIFPMAACALLLGVQLTDVPPGIGTRQEVLARYGLAGDS